MAMACFIALAAFLGTTTASWAVAARDRHCEAATGKQNEDSDMIAFIQTRLALSTRGGSERSLDAKELFGDNAKQHGHRVPKVSSAVEVSKNATNLKTEPCTRSNQSAELLEEDGTLLEPGLDCFRVTGGTCMAQNCSMSRGLTYCSSGRCMCKKGYCSSAGGICHEGPYKLLLDDFTIRNYGWTSEYMYASVFSLGVSYAVRGSKDNRTQQSRFRLFEMPDGAVILYSMAFPNFAVTIQSSQKSDNNDYDRDDYSYSVSMNNTGGSRRSNFGFAPKADWQALLLYEPPGRFTGAVMIGSYKYAGKYISMQASAFTPGISWEVLVSNDDLGYGALWIFDPPLPKGIKLNRFEGRIFSLDCSGENGFASKAAWYIGLGLIGIGLGICALLGCFDGRSSLLNCRLSLHEGPWESSRAPSSGSLDFALMQSVAF